MKKTLYIISKAQDDDMNAILSSPVPAEHSVSAILIQQGIDFAPTASIPCFVLENNMIPNQMAESYSKIQYSDMLQMIFESDTVISI